ncbi:hypothetical protein HMPREF3213_00876 [Heyndrickxia coagulans]|jgi:hypothetical protein|uniref:Uncharacterized protein n=1 Tax=Heyndrickxia coagulans TaxID=1398 RepID=A0A133KXL6_HEYCO|nr:hypothetical protein HMPREF3213_00876 [Heyndrickxia coagulans]
MQEGYKKRGTKSAGAELNGFSLGCYRIIGSALMYLRLFSCLYMQSNVSNSFFKFCYNKRQLF